jgi:hypothetical protein
VELSRTDYDRLVETGESLTDFMRHSPLAEAEDIEFPHERCALDTDQRARTPDVGCDGLVALRVGVHVARSPVCARRAAAMKPQSADRLATPTPSSSPPVRGVAPTRA